jgi:hypothetical protein
MMTKTLPTYAIQNGDIVQTYGCRFRVSNKRRTYPGMHSPVDMDGCAFNTEYVGPVTPDRDPIAEHGNYYGGDMVSGRWVIQGNARATWTVEA